MCIRDRCDTLDLEELIDAASKDTDTFYAYLSRTDYADGVKALKDGFSAFEKWCDDRQTALVKEISRQDYFTVAPLLGYVTARQNEISTAVSYTHLDVYKRQPMFCPLYVDMVTPMAS